MAKIVITTLSNSFTLNSVQVAKNDLQATYFADGASIANIYGNYNEITIDGESVSSRAELETLLDTKVFRNGGGSGEGATWGSITGDIESQSDLLELIQQSGGDVKSFELTAVGGAGEVVTHDTGDESIQDLILVPRNSEAINQGQPVYSVENGIISITTISTEAGEVLRYSYVAGSGSGSGESEDYVPNSSGAEWAVVAQTGEYEGSILFGVRKDATIVNRQIDEISKDIQDLKNGSSGSGSLSEADSKIIFSRNIYAIDNRPFTLFASSLLPNRNKSPLSRFFAFNSVNESGLPFQNIFRDSLEINGNRLGSTANIMLKNTGLPAIEFQLPINVYRSAENKSKSIVYIPMGDSITAQSTLALRNKFNSGSITPSFIGTRLRDGVRGEGRGGWEAADIVYIQTSSDPNGHAPLPIGGEQNFYNNGDDTRNPFIRVAVAGDPPADVKNGYIFDFRFYLDRFNFADPDVITLSYGTNDINRKGVDVGVSNVMEAYRIMIKSIRAACPNCKIGLAMPMNSNTSYFVARWQSGFVKLFLQLDEIYGTQTANNIFIISSHAYMTDDFIFPMNTVSTDAQTGQLKNQSSGTGYDGTHPIEGIGRSLYAEPIYQFIYTIC